MRRIRIAQIGINRYSHGPELFATMKQHPEIFDLVGYALVEDEREHNQRNIEKYYQGAPELTLEQILEDDTIEAVTVETDEYHLFKYAQMAAEHGKHIHMEKPGSQSEEDFQRLVETVRKNGKILHLGYMFRYNPVIQKAVIDANSGVFGSIFSVEAHMSRYDDMACRQWLSNFEGGMMFYLGSNLIDVIMRIQGEPKEIVSLNRSSGFGGIDCEDLGLAILKYDTGTSFVRTNAVELGGGERRQIVITGEKGTREIRPIEAYAGRAMTYFSEYTDTLLGDDGHSVREHKASEPFHRYLDMISSFAAMVRGEKENPYSLDYELLLHKTIMKCCKK